MKVAQYTFQSPSSSPVQVGKLDPSSIEKEQTKETKPQKSVFTTKAKIPEQSVQNDTKQVFQVKPTITQASIDTYA